MGHNPFRGLQGVQGAQLSPGAEVFWTIFNHQASLNHKNPKDMMVLSFKYLKLEMNQSDLTDQHRVLSRFIQLKKGILRGNNMIEPRWGFTNCRLAV